MNRPGRPTVRQIPRRADPDEIVQVCARVPRWTYRAARDFGTATGQSTASVLRAWLMDAAQEAQTKTSRGE